MGFSEVHLQNPTSSCLSAPKQGKVRCHHNTHLLPTIQPHCCPDNESLLQEVRSNESPLQQLRSISCFFASCIGWPPWITCPHSAALCPLIPLGCIFSCTSALQQEPRVLQMSPLCPISPIRKEAVWDVCWLGEVTQESEIQWKQLEHCDDFLQIQNGGGINFC